MVGLGIRDGLRGNTMWGIGIVRNTSMSMGQILEMIYTISTDTVILKLTSLSVLILKLFSLKSIATVSNMMAIEGQQCLEIVIQNCYLLTCVVFLAQNMNSSSHFYMSFCIFLKFCFCFFQLLLSFICSSIHGQCVYNQIAAYYCNITFVM